METLNKRHIFLMVAIAILIFGTINLWDVYQSRKNGYNEISTIGQSVAATISHPLILSLSAIPEDIKKVEYQELKKILRNVRHINQESRFAYIFSQRNGKIFFVADSEPANSKDYSPPGQEYKEATVLDRQLFEKNSQPIIEKSSDSWGKWVSVLVPIKDKVSGKTLAVFGMDFNARAWDRRYYLNLAQSMMIILLSMFSVFFLIIIKAKNELLEKDIHNLKAAELKLVKAKDKAEESDRLKTSFLTNMSHEIRTPMNSILGFTEILKTANLSGEIQQEYIEHIRESGKRMLHTMNDIIELSKIESGEVLINNSKICIGEQLNYFNEIYGIKAQRKGLEFICPILSEDFDLFFVSDVEKIKAVLVRIIRNAIKFTSSGSIYFGYTIKNQDINFIIQDTGIGISPEQLNYIFDHFRQGSEDHTRNYEGAGLGLAIAKAYTLKLGGRIDIESEPEKGSTFIVSIPLEKA